MTVAVTAIPFLDLSRQIRATAPETDAAIARVLKRASFILSGEVAAFEAAFARYVGARHAVGVASGTDAIALALRACGLAPGDLVVVPPNTAVPTVSAIGMAGGRPLFVDVEEDRLTLCPHRLERYLKGCRRDRRGAPRDRRSGWPVRAVVPVHLYGRPARLPEILRVARAYGLKVIEDAAQAHGARIGPKRVGAFGDAAAFSFYPTKNLGGLGDGGIVVTNSGDVAERVLRLRTYGSREPYLGVKEAGVNSRLDEIQAAVLGTRLRRLDRWNARRARLAEAYRRALRGLPLRLHPCIEGDVHHLFVVRVPHRDRLASRLQREGVGALVHYPVPPHRMKPYRNPLFRAGPLPNAERACREVLSLPLHPYLRVEELEAVSRAVRRCL